ncbi:hypothetical protein Fmac_009068 [Flemingia macrophylla]|uniref:Uncharacterized protein n=1 Tax=Flemingia macrophylla TaxID=520843 RepID=A0ABD1MZ82_9FABA
MNKVVEKFCNFSFARSYCEDMGNFFSYVISKHGENAMPAKFFVIIVCLSLFIYVLKKPKKKSSSCLLSRAFIIKNIHSFIPSLKGSTEDDFKMTRANLLALDNADKLLMEHLRQEFPDFVILQRNAAKMEMGAKEDDAEKILRNAFKKANNMNKPHEAYEIEMLLVEILICKGGKSDLETALTCKCLSDDSLKDARRPLFQAIIYQMQKNTVKAKECWDIFIEVRDPVRDPSYDGPLDYENFASRVGELQDAIKKV